MAEEVKSETTKPAADPIKLPVLWTNWITIFGLLNVAVGILLLVTFWLFHALQPASHDNQYLNVVGFMILPGVLMNGLAICPLGIWLKRRKLKKDPTLKYITTRGAMIFLALTFFLILPIMGVAGYQGYHFTESAEFCGTVCHNMDPQYVRYNQSAHARVTCVGCHIGPGATPFVKSKLSGLRQVYHTIKDDYPRPIPPAIHELRPARDTCEQCHWPNRFFGSKLKKIPHYAPDEKNTLNTYEVMIKIGGTNNALGVSEGIHAHMLDRVEYVTEVKKYDDNGWPRWSEDIPWVRYKNPDGSVRVFRNDGKADKEPPHVGHVRKLDCIDCHNLSGHEFVSPERSVDHALSVGQLDKSIPFIKREAVRVLAQRYSKREDGLKAIESELGKFYNSAKAKLPAQRQADIPKAIAAVQSIYTNQQFPDMKTDWKTYPSHIGHMESPGCFRCHDGLHVSDDGKVITKDCKACHTFLYREKDLKNNSDIIRETKFAHPNTIHTSWNNLGEHDRMFCTDCHDGGLGAMGQPDANYQRTCGDCHPKGRWEGMREEINRREAAALKKPSTQPTAPHH